MDTWYCKDIGDGVAAFQPTMELHKAFLALAQANRGVVTTGFGVFSYYDLRANVVTLYFSPDAVALAKLMGATPCDKPTPSRGFSLSVGDMRSWNEHFPDYLKT